MQFEWQHVCHHGFMVVQITIRNVPGDVRDALKSKAEAEGQSMQTFLLRRLKQIADTPTNAELMREAAERLKNSGTNVSVRDILKYLGRDSE
ncbi:MAG: hypothetical protein F4X77_06810 [Acidobacteriia bacterium]|nr:hypothetical protein [Terriglobia bacterium]MYC65014.1 hypothetical protein [Terriglobia bacterium]